MSPTVIIIGVVVLVILVAAVAMRASRKAAQEKFMADIREFGLEEYHRSLHLSQGDPDFLRRYMVFVAMKSVMTDLRDQGPGAVFYPSDPVEDIACQELQALGLLRADADGEGYERPQ